MTPLPPKATGNQPLVQAFNQLRQCVIERTVIQGAGVTLDRTALGMRVHAQAKGGSGKAGKSGTRGPARWV